MRPSGRAFDQMRALTFEPGFTKHAEGCCLVSFGDTRVLVTASVEDKLPPFLRGKGQDEPRQRSLRSVRPHVYGGTPPCAAACSILLLRA